MNNASDFKIEDGVLTKYVGPGGDVVIPDEVTKIGNYAFSHCQNVTKITIPNSVTTIGQGAFYACKKLETIIIPNSVDKIEKKAFLFCKKIKKISFPPDLKWEFELFGNHIPECLALEMQEKASRLSAKNLMPSFLNKSVWKKLSEEVQTDIFIAQHGRDLHKAYISCVGNVDVLGKNLLLRLSQKATKKEYSAVSDFILLFSSKASANILKDLHSALKSKSTGATKKVESNTYAMEMISNSKKESSENNMSSSTINVPMDEKTVRAKLSDFYSIKIEELPKILDNSSLEVPAYIFAYFLIAHEQNNGKLQGVESILEKPGISPEIEEKLHYMNDISLQGALKIIADRYLGAIGRSKKMYLAYPICRYADEQTMADLTKRAHTWKSKSSGNNAPALLTFRKACLYSNTRAAMVFADKFGDLEEYAKLRGTDADTIRDQHLSDVGFDENGCIKYDLGNQTVTAALQKDLTVLVQLPNGKTAKTLPKKGADEEKYALANEHFKTLKSNIKKIVKGRVDNLFEDFLSGRARPADEWKKAYLSNPLLRSVAQLLVWEQSGNTFTLTEGGAITADSSDYTIDAENIKLAHPMEMKKDDLKAWQQYFAGHGLKQPFAQIWEPVVDAAKVTEDRYKGCMIPYYRFVNQKKRGITIEDYDFHNDISISFKEIGSEIERIDMRRHEIRMNDRFEIKAISFEKMTRRVNHLLAYLDRVTVYDRIAKDDITIEQFLPQFTAAQIVDFIKLAQESNATNVLAILLEFKNQHYPDLDPMAEFVLE